MAKKIPRRLVALSSSAIAAIYFAGLLNTRTATDAVSAVAASVQPTSVATTAASSGPVSVGYQDGTYTGTGSGKFGSVTVSVSTAGGKITNVQITNVATTFPVAQIAGLPAQVVQSQSASVNAVSGATASSQAFKQAVQQALVQATTVTVSA